MAKYEEKDNTGIRKELLDLANEDANRKNSSKDYYAFNVNDVTVKDSPLP